MAGGGGRGGFASRYLEHSASRVRPRLSRAAGSAALLRVVRVAHAVLAGVTRVDICIVHTACVAKTQVVGLYRALCSRRTPGYPWSRDSCR